jgi:hypothetical protein
MNFGLTMYPLKHNRHTLNTVERVTSTTVYLRTTRGYSLPTPLGSTQLALP